MTDWEDDCREWRGQVLTGRYAHWCAEWDELPVDETCFEWPCGCYEGNEMDEQIREEDARRVVKSGKTQYWDWVNAALHEGQQMAIEGEAQISESSPMAAWKAWTQRFRALLDADGISLVNADQDLPLESPKGEDV